MGIVYSINHTTMAQSILGHKFRTNKRVCFGYSSCEQEWFIKKWHPKPVLYNPNVEYFEIEVSSPIEFMINNIIKNSTAENGVSINIKGRILNNIPIKNVGHCRESREKATWTAATVKSIKSSKFPKIKDGMLLTKNLDFALYANNFGITFPKTSSGDYYYNGSITVEPGILTPI